VDPAKEVAAARDAVALGIVSRTQLVKERGGDIATVAADLRAEAVLLDGVVAPATPAPAAPPDPTDVP